MNNLLKLKNSLRLVNIFKMLGIIALVAVIGFSFAGCGSGAGDDGTTNGGNAPAVTFTLQDGTAGDNKFEVIVDGTQWTGGWSHAEVVAAFQEGDYGVNYDYTVTWSEDKKTAVVSLYDSKDNAPYYKKITEDVTLTVKFGPDAGKQSTSGGELIRATSLNHEKNLDHWTTDEDGDNFSIYTGTIALKGTEGVSVTVKNDDYNPEP